MVVFLNYSPPYPFINASNECLFINCPFNQNCHSGPDLHRDKLQPESRVPGENRDPVFEMVPDFRRDDVWIPPYQVRGRLLKSGMTEKAVYGQTLIKDVGNLVISGKNDDLLSLVEWKPTPFPCLHTTGEALYVLVSHRYDFRCLTGSSPFMRSAAIENDLLIFW